MQQRSSGEQQCSVSKMKLKHFPCGQITASAAIRPTRWLHMAQISERCTVIHFSFFKHVQNATDNVYVYILR